MLIGNQIKTNEHDRLNFVGEKKMYSLVPI